MKEKKNSQNTAPTSEFAAAKVDICSTFFLVGINEKKKKKKKKSFF